MLVSVVMITYGHELYISSAIESILMQDYDNLELIISNDNSPDKTDEIIKRLIKEHPKGYKIKYYLQEKNLGMMPNFIFALQKAKGKFIALCEGDDYWTDYSKIKKQVAILKMNNDCVLCFTDNSRLYEEGRLVKSVKKNINDKTGFIDLLRGNFIATVTVLFEKPFDFQLPIWFNKIKIGDWPLYLFLMKDGGKAYYLREDTAIYRYGVGVSSNLRKENSLIVEVILELLESLLKENEFVEFYEEIEKEIKRKKVELFKSFIRENNWLRANKIYIELLSFKNVFFISKLYLYCLYQKIK